MLYNGSSKVWPLEPNCSGSNPHKSLLAVWFWQRYLLMPLSIRVFIHKMMMITISNSLGCYIKWISLFIWIPLSSMFSPGPFQLRMTYKSTWSQCVSWLISILQPQFVASLFAGGGGGSHTAKWFPKLHKFMTVHLKPFCPSDHPYFFSSYP